MDIVIKLMADGLIVPIVVVAAYALLFRVASTDRYDVYMRIFMAGITAYILAKFAGSIWQPEQLRPFEQLGVDPGASYLNNPGFPSDHALFAAFLTVAVAFATRSRGLTITMALLTIGMCVGRVLALVHTPLDIAGALVIAAIGAAWYIGYDKKHAANPIAKRAKK